MANQSWPRQKAQNDQSTNCPQDAVHYRFVGKPQYNVPKIIRASIIAFIVLVIRTVFFQSS